MKIIDILKKMYYHLVIRIRYDENIRGRRLFINIPDKFVQSYTNKTIKYDSNYNFYECIKSSAELEMRIRQAKKFGKNFIERKKYYVE